MKRSTFVTIGALVLGVFIGGALCSNTALAAGGSRVASQKTVPSGKVTPWEAMATARAKTHQRPVQATFEFEDGHWQYAVLTAGHGSATEVEINAQTGKVGDVEKADPAGEAKELQTLLAREMKQR
jgi:hypothetical protein